MIRGLRRLLLILMMLLALSLTANAQSEYGIKELTVRLNNVGAEAQIEIKGTPGSLVSVELLRPDATVGQAYTEDDLMNVFAGFDMVEIPQSGKAIYTYTAEDDLGVYNFRVYGEIESVSYTATDNEVPLSKPDDFFTTMWSEGLKTTVEDHIQGPVWVRKNVLTNNVKANAEIIKKEMDRREPGKRYLYIHTDSVQDILTQGTDVLWKKENVEELAALLDNFFSIYYEVGGELDGIYTDNEAVMNTWQVRGFNPDGLSTTAEIIDRNLENIVSDPTYTNYLRPKLVERGFNFKINTDLGRNELYDVGYYQAYVNPDKVSKGYSNYLIWDAVTANYKNECLTKGIYEPAKKYFPNVYYCNYSSGDRIAADYTGGVHKYELGGDRTKAGTHSCPVLYDSSAGSPYLEVRGLANSMRGVMLATEGGKVMPWVVSKGYHNFSHISEDLPYFYEYLFHIALCNPEVLLLYGPRYYSDDPTDRVQLNITGMREALEEFNEYAVKADAQTLIENRMNTQDFMVSGMYTNGRNLWRITPDNTVVSVENFLKSDDGNPTFYVSGQTVTFPGGTILDNMYSEYGYWVETEAGVEPTITYDEVPETTTLTYRYYDKFGIEITEDIKWEDVYTVAIYVDGLLENVSDKEMNVAKYDGNKLVNVEPLKSDIWTGKNPRLISYNIKGKTNSKLLTWQSLESLVPLMPALPWRCR